MNTCLCVKKIIIDASLPKEKAILSIKYWNVDGIKLYTLV